LAPTHQTSVSSRWLRASGPWACQPPPGAARTPGGGLEALAGALDDELALELVDRAEKMEDQPPGRRGRVDLLLQDDQADAGRGET